MTTPLDKENDGALSHLRILEYGDIPASYATRWLGDLGADVIKIEKPGGDGARMLGPFSGNVPNPEKSLTFINANILEKLKFLKFLTIIQPLCIKLNSCHTHCFDLVDPLFVNHLDFFISQRLMSE